MALPENSNGEKTLKIIIKIKKNPKNSCNNPGLNRGILSSSELIVMDEAVGKDCELRFFGMR